MGKMGRNNELTQTVFVHISVCVFMCINSGVMMKTTSKLFDFEIEVTKVMNYFNKLSYHRAPFPKLSLPFQPQLSI